MKLHKCLVALYAIIQFLSTSSLLSNATNGDDMMDEATLAVFLKVSGVSDNVTSAEYIENVNTTGNTTSSVASEDDQFELISPLLQRRYLPANTTAFQLFLAQMEMDLGVLCLILPKPLRESIKLQLMSFKSSPLVVTVHSAISPFIKGFGNVVLLAGYIVRMIGSGISNVGEGIIEANNFVAKSIQKDTLPVVGKSNPHPSPESNEIVSNVFDEYEIDQETKAAYIETDYLDTRQRPSVDYSQSIADHEQEKTDSTFGNEDDEEYKSSDNTSPNYAEADVIKSVDDSEPLDEAEVYDEEVIELS